jgi:hypothetical protein
MYLFYLFSMHEGLLTRTILITIWQRRPVYAKNQCSGNVRMVVLYIIRVSFSFSLSFSIMQL